MFDYFKRQNLKSHAHLVFCDASHLFSKIFRGNSVGAAIDLQQRSRGKRGSTALGEIQLPSSLFFTLILMAAICDSTK